MDARPSKKVKTVPTGDDLEDNFVLEDDFAPASSPDLDEAGTALDEDIAHEEPPETPAEEESSGKPTGAKKRKRDKKDKFKLAKGGEEEDAVLPSLGLSPPEVLADAVGYQQAKALPKLTALEKEDLRITEFMILDTSSVTERTSLFSFIRAAIPTLPSTLAKVPKKEGAPRVIVIAGAALRVADLCRDVKPYKTKEIEVAKLFAKHFKFEDHVKYLKEKKIGIAVGTANRIGKLLEDETALSLTHLSHLFLDVSHHNTKKQSLLDMKDCQEDLFKLVLGNKGLLNRLREGKMKIIFF